jgi:M6 family metalloprotease-like protein
MPPLAGPVAPEVAAGFARGLFDVPVRVPGPESSAGISHWRLPIIRVAFTDSALVHPQVALEQRLFDTTGAVATGSLAEYYRWASRGRLQVSGEIVATVTLSRDRNYFASDAYGVNVLETPNNSFGMFREAVSACDDVVDFSRFDQDNDGYVDMLWVVHAGPGAETTGRPRDLWSITSRASAGWSNGIPAETNDLVPGSLLQHMRIDRFTVLPELSGLKPGQLCEIGVYCHEFGHSLGLPDLYDTSVLGGAANVGPGAWSLMSSGAYGGNGFSPESPSHLGAWPLLWLGWASRVRPTQDTTLVLRPVADSGTILDFWFQGEDASEHFLIENRFADGFDRTLLEGGLVVHQVDEAVVGSRLSGNRVNTGPTPGMRVLEADGHFDMYYGLNRGDVGDPFPGQSRKKRVDDLTTPATRTFAGAPTNIALEDIVRIGRDVSVRVRVRAAGWQAARQLAPGAAEPREPVGPAARSAISPSGRAWHVTSEPIDGRQSVVVRERPWLQPWGPAVPLDRAIGAATEPTIARVGDNDLAVAWIETDAGVPGRLVYRSRIRGTWSKPVVLTPVTEGCSVPAIAADARGRVYVSWLEIVGGQQFLRFMRFLHALPYGQPGSITGPNDWPSPPAVTAAGDGHAYVLWSDRGSGTPVAYGCRFHPDSGLSARVRIAPQSAYAQPWIAGAVDSSGILHSVWQVSPGYGGEIHYQRRGLTGRPTPRDTTLDVIGNGLQNPRIALDPTGALHVSYERSVPTGLQVRYKRWKPGLGWDHRATEVSDANDVTASASELMPTSSGNITMTWIGYGADRPQLRERVRQLDGPLVLEAPPLTPVARVALAAGTNPFRPGPALEFLGEALVPGAVVELLDAFGRRVARTVADEPGRARFRPADTRALPAGLYFASVRGSDVRGRVVVLR